MNDDLGYLTQELPTSLDTVKAVAKLGEQLKKLKQQMLAAETAYTLAKDAYEHYAKTVVPAEMHAVGLSSIDLESGGHITTVKNFYCQPNKNAADRAIIAAWVRSNGGADLIKAQGVVSDIDALKAAHVPYKEETTLNTNQLKAFIKDKLGLVNGVATLKVEDIPACIHFQEVTTVDLEMPADNVQAAN